MNTSDAFSPIIGTAQELEPGLRRIVAPNPSPMTYKGTNTYLVGTRDIAVIDPGPNNPDHLQAILGALRLGQFISHIIVTHTHLDHSPLSRPLSLASNAPVLGFGSASAGRSARMTQLVQSGFIGGGEGIDTGFFPDRLLGDGDIICGDGWQLRIIHTPGHIGNHICLAWEDRCFTADHVMGWASSLVSPPDGDLTDFMASCERLKEMNWRVFYPGHGAPVATPNARLEWLISHRRSRECAILSELSSGSSTAKDITRRVYKATPPGLLLAAERNVLAHLIDLTDKSLVTYRGALDEYTVFEAIHRGTE